MLDVSLGKAQENDDHKLLAIGSILHFAKDGDVIWGSGINGKHLKRSHYSFNELDVRAVRGPLTRGFLQKLGITVPEVYGDPALLFPYFFPEFYKQPKRKYLIIPHISEIDMFPEDDSVVYPTEPWEVVVQKITESEFVISSSLHGIIIAEAFGIPARLLRVTGYEPLYKYRDYYLGTGRKGFRYARSVNEALIMGGEKPCKCDLEKLLATFPWDCF